MPAPLAAWLYLAIAVPMVVADAPADRYAAIGPDLTSLLDLGGEAWCYEAWPGHPRATCRAMSGHGYESFYEDLWCFECVVDEEACRAAFRFFPDLSRGACTLQEVQVEILVDRRGLSPVVTRTVEARLGQPTPPSASATREIGCSSGGEIRRWAREDDFACLYLDEYGLYGRLPPPREAAGLLWRRAPLTGLRDEDPESPARHEDRPAVAAEACRDARLAQCDGAICDQRAHVAAVHAALDLLEKLPPSSPRAAPLAYWLNYMAGDESGHLLSGNASERERLAQRGVLYVDARDWLELQNPWLRDLAERQPRSKWGQRAFLELIRHHVGDDDPNGDAFRVVIRRGEAWLREHPGTAIDADLRLELALAYETWWSLSKAAPDRWHPEESARYAEGAEQARRRAIQLYRRVRPLDAHERIWLEQRLFRLERDIDTVQRAFDRSGC